MPGGRDIRAGRAFIELSIRSHVVRGLRAAQRRLRAFGQGMSSVGRIMVGVGVAMAAPFVLATRHFMKAGDEVHKMALRTGVSTNALSELGFAAEQSGTDLATLEKGIRTMQRSIFDAGRGLSTQTDALKAAGLEYKDLADLAPENQFKKIAEGISNMQDPSQRAAVAMMLLGRAGTALLPMMTEGAKGIETLMKEARELGLSIGPEQAQAAANLTDAWNRAKRALTGAFFSIGSAAADSITKMLGTVKTFLVNIGKWVSENKALVVTIFKVAIGVTAAGVAIFIVGQLFIAAAAIIGGVIGLFGLLASAVGLILSPIGLTVIAIGGLGYAFLKHTDTGKKALSGLQSAFGEMKGYITKSMGSIMNALSAGDMEGAMELSSASIKLIWTRLTTWLQTLWEEFKGWWSGHTNSIASVMIDALAIIRKAWASMLGTMTKAWEKWKVSTFTEGLAGLLAPIFAKLEGVSTEEARKALREDMSGGRASLKDRLAAIDAETEAEQKRLEANRLATQQALAEDKTNADKQRAARIAALEKEHADAKAAWEKVIGEQEAKRADEAKKRWADRFAEWQKSHGGTPGEAMVGAMAGAVRGGFSGTALATAGGGGPMERVAKAVEKQLTKQQQQLETADKVLGEVKRLTLEATA